MSRWRPGSNGSATNIEGVPPYCSRPSRAQGPAPPQELAIYARSIARAECDGDTIDTRSAPGRCTAQSLAARTHWNSRTIRGDSTNTVLRAGGRRLKREACALHRFKPRSTVLVYPRSRWRVRTFADLFLQARTLQELSECAPAILEHTERRIEPLLRHADRELAARGDVTQRRSIGSIGAGHYLAVGG